MGMDGEVEAARPSDALTKLSTEELAISSRLDFLPVLPLELPDDLDEPWPYTFKVGDFSPDA